MSRPPPSLARRWSGWPAPMKVDTELRRDLLQGNHIAIWQSLARFDGRCSERTWVYPVAHNIGASHVRRRPRIARERSRRSMTFRSRPDPRRMIPRSRSATGKPSPG